MQAEWNVNRIAEMGEEENLLNLCRQIEQDYVEWARSATFQGQGICREWPAIGELGRYRVAGVRLRFVSTRNREVEVHDPQGVSHGRIPMKNGMADELYRIARAILLTAGCAA